MTGFPLFALLLLVVVLALIIPPLWFGPRRAAVTAAVSDTALDQERRDANVQIFRGQLEELAREHAEGKLSDAVFAQSKQEIQKRLLEEVDRAESEAALPATAAAAAPVRSRKMAIFLMLVLPLSAGFLYLLLGNPQALDPARQQAAARSQPQMTPEQIQGMVDQLAARLKEQPDDVQGWLMLGRSYKTMGRYEEAVAAFAKAEKMIEESPDWLATYAETIALASGKGLAGKPRMLVKKALKLERAHPHALFLAGAAAMEAGDYQEGIGYWETLLPMAEEGSDVEKMLRQGIEQMRAKLK